MKGREVLIAIRQAIRFCLDIVLPPIDPFQEDEKKWKDICFLEAPCCAQCGFPFEYDVGEGVQCAACLVHPPRYSTARSAMVYDDASRPLVLAFKHGGKTDNLSKFAAQLRRVGRHSLADADYIIPVPLHTQRLIKRRYNQSALLARALAKITIVPFHSNLLHRVRATPSQGGQSAAGRKRNVQGAFSVPENGKAQIKGANIILVDDVMTTGATVEACASILLRSGAKRVDVLCLARVIRKDVQTESI